MGALRGTCPTRPLLVATIVACAGVVTITGLIVGFGRAFLLTVASLNAPSALLTPPVRIAEALVVLSLGFLLAWKAPPLPP